MSERIVGDYGTSVIAPPDKPEDPSRWRQQQLTDSELLKRHKWTAAQLAAARIDLGFPQERVFTTIPVGDWAVKTTRRTDLRDVEKWESSARSLGLLK
jgi:hypothetical protein